MDIKIKPFAIRGELTAPPSKSFAHRYMIAAFLSGGKCSVENVGDSDDVNFTLSAIKDLGAIVSRHGDAVEISGRKTVEKAVVGCGESGSTLRFLIPVAAALGINAEFTGKGKLLSRPIDDLAYALSQGGAKLSGHTVSGRLKSGEYRVNAGVSSQVITGMLFALSFIKGESRLILTGNIVSAGYIDITLEVLKEFGIQITRRENVFEISGGFDAAKIPTTCRTEGDWSGAAFPLAMAATGGAVTVKGLNFPSLQRDCVFLEILKNFGAWVKIEETKDGAEITVKKGNLSAITADCENIPDLAQAISVVAAYADGVTVLRGVERLRLKESDRISAIIQTLGCAGIKAEHVGGEIKIYGGRPHGGKFYGGKDHRTVMSAAALAAGADGDSVIEDAEYYAKSYPEFIEDIKKAGGDGNVII